jgi:hypothetical protein
MCINFYPSKILCIKKIFSWLAYRRADRREAKKIFLHTTKVLLQAATEHKKARRFFAAGCKFLSD